MAPNQAIADQLRPAPTDPAGRAAELLAQMTLAEKIGQLCLANGDAPELPEAVREGRVGAVLNEVNPDRVRELQHQAVANSRLGIPLLIGRDVVHGFKTIFPIPLGQAASWDPKAVRNAAGIAAAEAAGAGVNWTFAPMIDVTRDPRWGRVAESLGEDPVLCGKLGAAMIEGFQGGKQPQYGPRAIAACAKHFAAYGAVEGGLDYNSASVPEIELRNVYLRPFKYAVDAGVLTFMSAFNEVNGVPATANEFLLRRVLRQEWGFEGMVVSDWHAIRELIVHGFSGDDETSALQAARAGIDMEMADTLYQDHLPGLVQAGRCSERQLDEMVRNVLTVKFRLGLFDRVHCAPEELPPALDARHLQAARELARKSCVLLKNEGAVLPLRRDGLRSIAVLGPLADDGYEQLGTWVFDGEAGHSVSCLQAIREMVASETEIHWTAGLAMSRSRDESAFAEAVEKARASEVALMFLGEESILSGEAHCRADISLPGSQARLVEAVAATGTPVVLVLLAGRPLTLENVIDKAAAVLYAWHPGTMGGPAIADLLFGVESPCGKLPISFPRMAGQIPVYYARKNTGRPASADAITHIDAIDGKAPQTSLGMSAFYLDAGFQPRFHFGFGLSYTHFEYSDLQLSSPCVALGGSLQISASVRNAGAMTAEEVVQLYVRDLVASVTRPVKELKDFQRLRLQPGESRNVCFDLHTDELAFFDRHMQRVVEAGDFHVWVGSSSEPELWGEFRVTAPGRP